MNVSVAGMAVMGSRARIVFVVVVCACMCGFGRIRGGGAATVGHCVGGCVVLFAGGGCVCVVFVCIILVALLTGTGGHCAAVCRSLTPDIKKYQSVLMYVIRIRYVLCIMY